MKITLKNGDVFETEDPNEIEQAIKMLLNSPDSEIMKSKVTKDEVTRASQVLAIWRKQIGKTGQVAFVRGKKLTRKRKGTQRLCKSCHTRHVYAPKASYCLECKERIHRLKSRASMRKHYWNKKNKFRITPNLSPVIT